MRSKYLATSLCCLVLSLGGIHGQSVHTPAAGTAERKAIVDVLRVPAEKDLGRKVIFKVSHLRVAGDWAFARVVPIQPDGKEIDYSRTKYREQMESGAFDAEAETLLRRVNGKWKLLEWRFGASDTEVELWLQKYRMPKALLQ